MKDLTGWTIAFDLDGTLVETAPDLIGTLNRLLAARGLPPRPIEAARHLVGHGAVALLKDGFREAGAEWDEAE
jgi:phosphoglycolate phosphatase